MMHERVLALAGLVQALKQVRRIADTGQADASALSTALDSVFRIDADSPESVYGTTGDLRPGLVLLRDYFGNRNKDEALPRLALAVMQIERRFVRDGQMAQQVHDGIVATAPLAERLGRDHPAVLPAPGTPYADTVPTLRPTLQGPGNPHKLGHDHLLPATRPLPSPPPRPAL